MSRFYGSLYHSAETDTTREGTATTGIISHIRGWKSGVRVCAYVTKGADYFGVYMTLGDGDRGLRGVRIGEVVITPEGPRWEPATDSG